LQEIFDPQPAVNDRFGKAVALDGHAALIGAQTDLIGTTRPGQVFFYAEPAQTAVPGPGTLTLLLCGLASFIVSRRRTLLGPG
jgi:hypothetical protein